MRLIHMKWYIVLKAMPSDRLDSLADAADELPLHSLRVFIAAVRCGSFSAAAKEFAVTQSAISRQVQQLEEHLGVTLFVRHKLGLRLTPDAEALFPAVEDAFARLTRACNRLRDVGQVLTLRMAPTLAVRWFLPRLPMLRSLLPKVDVRITTYEARHPRPENNDVDAILLYGRGNWPDMECIRLFPERLTPVCSPQIAQSLSVPADLRGMHLLQTNPLIAWGRWLEAAGVSWIPSYGETFDTLEFALSAATRGQGVALGDLSLLHEALHDGVLVAPFDSVVDLGNAYYLIYSPEKGALPKIRALREWLTSEVESPA